MSTPQNTAKNRDAKPVDPGRTDRVERIIVGIVLFVITVVPLLTFLFSFGNVGDLGVSLRIDRRIAYLTGPAVDLTATGMIVAATWLSYKGRSERELWRIHTLSIICALIMFALNCGPAIYKRYFMLAGFSAVGPFLLMAMGFVGPWLLRQITDARTPAAAPGTGRRERAASAAKTPPASPPAPIPAPAVSAPAAASGSQRPAAAPRPVPTAADTGTRDADIVDINGSGRISMDYRAMKAVKIYRQYIEDYDGLAPTAAVLASLLRSRHPELNAPRGDRSERILRSKTEDLYEAGYIEVEDEAGQPASTDETSEAVS